jgi:hypothetical protein
VYSKEEFPPLLGEGFHHMSLAGVADLCVAPFSLSTTRNKIMAGLHAVTKRIAKAGITGEVWLDGSFVTEKMDPSDSDIVVMVPAEFYDAGTEEQRSVIEWLISNENEPKQLYACDAYVHLRYRDGSPEKDLWLPTLNRWQRIYGYGVKNAEPKGIVILDLEGL